MTSNGNHSYGSMGKSNGSTLSENSALLADKRRNSSMDAPSLKNFVGYVEHGKSLDTEPGKVESPESKKARNKLLRATMICFSFMLLEIAGGYIAGSLAIMTDAAHLLSDVAGFLISLFALYLGNRKATPILSFGFKRAEIVGAILSVMLIWFLTGVLLWEAVLRTKSILNHTREEFVDGKIMTIVAIVGLFANMTLLFVLGHDHGHSHFGGGHGHAHDGHDDDHHDDHGHAHDHGHSHGSAPKPKKQVEDHGHSHDHGHAHSHGHDDHDDDHHSHDEVRLPITGTKGANAPKAHNINVTAAYVHAIGDLIQSAGVCIAGILIWIFPGETHPTVQLADPIVTFLFSIMVLMSTYNILKTSLNVLMEGVPDGYDPLRIARELVAIEGVIDVHHLHIWSLTVGEPSLSVHIVVDNNTDMEQALWHAQHVLRENKISHSTVQTERRVGDAICETEDGCDLSCDRYALNCAKNGACYDNAGLLN